MKTYTRNEIENRHGQRIYYFSKQAGNTELEKCINFNKLMNAKFEILTTKTINSGDISILLIKGGTGCVFEVFNDIGEKVGECEPNYKPKSILDMQEDLEDLGFII